MENLGYAFSDAFRSANTGTPLAQVRGQRKMSMLNESIADQGLLENNLINDIMTQVGAGEDMADSDALRRLMVLNPQRAQSIKANTLMDIPNAPQALAAEYYKALGQFSIGDNMGAIGTLGQVGVLMGKAGGDPSLVNQMIQGFETGDKEATQQSMAMLNGIVDNAIGFGLLGDVKNPFSIEQEGIDIQKSKIYENGLIVNALKGGKGAQVIGPDGVELSGKDAEQAIKGAKQFEIELERQEQKLLQETTEAKERTKDKIERERVAIDDGLTFSQMIPEMNRALTLLKDVETGNLDQYQLNAKRFFGVEGADEAELSNILETNIIKQIKPMFGAQVTVQEGQWLRDIEEGFGKSTEANVRLLNQGLKLAKKRAEIGIDAANTSNDPRAAKTIMEWMNFRLPDQTEQQPDQATQSIAEGTAATNPTTGERIVFRGGKWEKIQ